MEISPESFILMFCSAASDTYMCILPCTNASARSVVEVSVAVSDVSVMLFFRDVLLFLQETGSIITGRTIASTVPNVRRLRLVSFVLSLFIL